jgi:hypothetical protein
MGEKAREDKVEFENEKLEKRRAHFSLLFNLFFYRKREDSSQDIIQVDFEFIPARR